MGNDCRLVVEIILSAIILIEYPASCIPDLASVFNMGRDIERVPACKINPLCLNQYLYPI